MNVPAPPLTWSAADLRSRLTRTRLPEADGARAQPPADDDVQSPPQIDDVR